LTTTVVTLAPLTAVIVRCAPLRVSPRCARNS
jgi:hypothetical protein